VLTDNDGDGVWDLCDNCENYNPLQEDDDEDEVPDACDNCSPSNPAHDCSGLGCANPGQEDCELTPTVGIGDLCDPDFSDCDGDSDDDCCDDDTDGDGVPDVDDACPFNHPSAYVDATGRPLGDFDEDCNVFGDNDDYWIFIHNYAFYQNCADTSASCVAPPASE